MQAIETLARKVAKQVAQPDSPAVALAGMQLEQELAFCGERRKMVAEQSERNERVAAKLNHIMQLRKPNPTVQEMERMYDQV